MRLPPLALVALPLVLAYYPRPQRLRPTSVPTQNSPVKKADLPAEGLHQNVYLVSARDYLCLSPSNMTLDLSTVLSTSSTSSSVPMRARGNVPTSAVRASRDYPSGSKDEDGRSVREGSDRVLKRGIEERDSSVRGKEKRDGSIGLEMTNTSNMSYVPGTVVNKVNCTQAQTWDISFNQAGSITLSGTELVLEGEVGDFGRLFLNNVTNSTGQNWFWTRDDHIAIVDAGKCLDDGDGNVEVYTCYGNNVKQTWIVGDLDTANQAPIREGQGQNTICTDIPPGTPMNDTQGDFSRIHPCQRSDLCVSALDCQQVNGTLNCPSLGVTYCVNATDPSAMYQFFDLTTISNGSNPLTMSPSDSFTCWNAGPNPQTGDQVGIDSCQLKGSGMENWEYTDDLHLATTGDQCLAVIDGSTGKNTTPWNSLSDLQLTECDPIDQHQMFLTP
ncbi:hypothetical protein M231_04424 [Tremella mesenterica]|uniref:Ricin B lectin domain-containing protein n=1 Tax=Tremella mesenterica TaxID=5217 RepID=A0A4Q1BKV7_TREME|nr:uncharacterized protein TREMEDRAFT_61071 [Tremella mesenterica DSM 1558]EIW70566.1 hypothetical protein TREMEDRAFT_61071 [Tremella mesenterica DSM 1558]RXK38252.1 hypothetical protein M231_04424 [Tremella mesenterica]